MKKENRRWTKEEEQIIIDNFGKISTSKIVEMLPYRTYGAIKSRAINVLKLTGNYRPPNKHSFNNKFWANPNLLNSYWAGFIAADGSIGIYNKSYTFSLCLSDTDKDHLNLFKNTVESTKEISHRVKKSPNSNNLCYSSTLLINAAQEWHKDLKKNWNIVPTKTMRLAPPNIYKLQFLFAWLIGYIDGDGCISKLNDNRLVIAFTSSSYKILEWIKEFLEIYFPHKQRERNITISNNSDNCYKYFIGGFNAALIINYLRKIPVPKLERKWNNPKILERLYQLNIENTEEYKFLNLPSLDSYKDF